ncbi:MAG: zinc ribbon domain-containing protein [Lachnospiraceae bacterium]|nr:zinc ribbon domain-containing protein [Lachnospiraceae bacterium]
MKQRTIVEMMLSACPNCGEANTVEGEFCRRCGSSMVVRERLLKELEEGIMPEGEAPTYPMLESTVSPADRIPLTWKLFYLGLMVVSTFLASVTLALDPSKYFAALTIFVMGCLFMIVAFLYVENNRYLTSRELKKHGERIKGVVIGYRRQIIPITVQHGSSLVPQSKIVLTVQVFAKINDVNTIVIMQAPDGVSEITHPRGTEVTIAGFRKQFIMLV